MKIEELNSCFDAISPTVEQRDKMFANIMNAKKQPVKVVRFYRYATAAAAVFVIGIFGVVYSTMGINNITDNTTKTMLATEIVKDDVAKTETERLPEIVSEERKLADSMLEAYPVAPEVINDTKVAVVEEIQEDVVLNDVVEDVPMIVAENEATAFAASGGGARSAEVKDITLEQIMADEIYSKLVPTKLAGEFIFASANINGNDLYAVFEDAYGKYMSVSITSVEDYGIRDCVEVADIVGLKAEYGYFNFTVICGEHYVSYTVECDDALQVYEMVKSTEYFKN